MMKKNRIVFIINLFFCLFVSHVSAEEALTWGDCLVEARKNNPDLIAAQETVNQTQADKTITASGLYPQIDASMSGSTAKKSSSTTDAYSYGVSGTQLVFDGLKTVNDVKGAKENIKASQQAYRFISSNTRLNLRSAFVNLLKAQEFIDVAEDIVKIRRDSLVLITLRYQSGLEHKGALMTAEANLSEANFELAQAQRDIELYQRQLTKEMGSKDFKPMVVKGDFVVSDSVKVKPNFEEIVKNNPSFLEATAKKNFASFNIKSAYADFFPQLSASAGADKSSAHWPPENDGWNMGLTMTMPIFEGGSRVAEVKKAKAAYNEAEANERSIKDAAIFALEQTWVSLQDTIELVDVRLKTLDATQERAKIAEAQYSNGFINFDDWIIIQNDLVVTKKTYLNAKANALLAEANWIQAKGETIEYAP
jgi:outer membrane protein TolC